MTLAINVTDATFETDVIQPSYQTPVVVYFWAGWCGPCKRLGPLLARLAADANGAWTLAKLDIDRPSPIVQQYQVKSIPTVLAFKQGRVVAQFVGLLPEDKVRHILSALA